MSKIKAIVSEKTIVLHYKGNKINIQRQTDETLFKEISILVNEGKEAELIKKFKSIKDIAEKFSDKVIKVDQTGQAYLKDSKIAIPKGIIKKLVELDKDKQDFLPLIRFWRKLQMNPSRNSRDQLYGFMIANHIPLTEQGDIVVEKGVSQKRGGVPGELIDGHSGTVDNSVGSEVEMPRGKVVDDPQRTCSTGLHVAAPDFVRNHWNQPIIIECVVNPKDVVSVPVDYNNTKMRVCRYKVMGYSSKTKPRANQVVQLSDFILIPDGPTLQALKDGVTGGKQHSVKSGDNVITTQMPTPLQITTSNEYQKEIDSLSASKIIAYVKEVTGKEITIGVKNKKAIVKKALELLEIFYSTQKIAEAQAKEPVTVETVKKVEVGPWSVRMTSVGKNKIAVVKLFNDLFKGGLKASKDTVDKGNAIIISGASKRFAQRYVDSFAKTGATLEMFKPNVDKIAGGGIDFTQMTIPGIIKAVKEKFNEKIGSRTPRAKVIEIATRLYIKAGWSVLS